MGVLDCALEGNSDKDDLPPEDKGGSGPGNKPYAYGKTKDWNIGLYVANNPEPGQSGSGRFKDPWNGNEKPFTEAKSFSYNPDMSDEPHTPATYRGASNANLNGTRKTDVWRHNPRAGYMIKATINNLKTYEATVRMDEVDVIRQEYINHLLAAQSTAANLIVEVPERDELVNKNSLGAILQGDWSQSDYTYLVNKHLTMLANIARDHVDSEPAQTVNVLSDTNIDLPDGAVISAVMRINSGWRNPERNERVGGVATSRHMLGRALDIGAEGVPGYGEFSENRAKMMWVMWNALQNAPATKGNIYIRYLMENGTTGLIQTGSPSASKNKPTTVTIEDDILSDLSVGSDGIPDDFNRASHFHVETKPNLSVGD